MTDTSQTDTWIAAAKGGDRFALAKLLATYHPRLRARAEARMHPALKVKRAPDDLVQDTFLEVVQQIHHFRGNGPVAFLSWVCTILDHKLIDARRAAHCQARDVNREVAVVAGSGSSSYWNLLDQVYADSGTPSRCVRRQEALAALLASVSDLSETHRQVIRMRFLEGRSVNDVAQHLDKSEAAVVALTQRALEALRKAMDRAGEFTRWT